MQWSKGQMSTSLKQSLNQSRCTVTVVEHATTGNGKTVHVLQPAQIVTAHVLPRHQPHSSFDAWLTQSLIKEHQALEIIWEVDNQAVVGVIVNDPLEVVHHKGEMHGQTMGLPPCSVRGVGGSASGRCKRSKPARYPR